MPSEVIEAAGFRIQFLLEGDETNEALSVFRCDLKPGTTTPAPHSHDGFDETVYCLKGEVNFVIEGKAHKLTPGDLIHTPRGAVHGFSVAGDEEATILCVSTPGIFYPAYFREMTEILEAAGDGPPDREAMSEVMKRHGLTPAIPATT
jgi:quercetin dioxygenase-like cupin family protein